jgi:Protein of unknown function (DUF3489)
MSKSVKKRAVAPSAISVPVAKAAQPAARKAKRPNSEPGSKLDSVIAMLKSPTGATIDAMMKATGWQQHSVRGFLAGVVRKRIKPKLGSKKVDGKRIYQITSGAKNRSESRSQSKRRSS